MSVKLAPELLIIVCAYLVTELPMVVKSKISILKFLLVSFACLGTGACSYKDIGPHKPVTAKIGGADKAGIAVPYSQVKPLFEARCNGCHNWHTNENAAIQAARNGTIQDLVSRGLMPKAGSAQAAAITLAERAQIVAWADGVRSAVGQGTGPVTPSPVDTISDRGLAFAYRCMNCHGPQGTSRSSEFPNLAGHSKSYIVNRLLEFMKPGARGSIMPGQMQVLANEFGLKDENDANTMEMLNYVAAFYGTYDLSVSADDMAEKRKSLSAAESDLYEVGRKVVNENQCTSCHLQANLRPIDGSAMIFAQKQGYLLVRLDEMKKGLSGTVMPGILEPLSDEDLKAIAVYLSLTHPSEHK